MSMPELHEHRHRGGAIIGNIDGSASHQDLEDCQPGLPEGRNHYDETDYDDMPALVSDSTTSEDAYTSDEMPGLVSDSTTSEDDDEEAMHHTTYSMMGGSNQARTHPRVNQWDMALQQEATRTMLLMGIIQTSTNQELPIHRRVMVDAQDGVMILGHEFDVPGSRNEGWIEAFLPRMLDWVHSRRRFMNQVTEGLSRLRRMSISSATMILIEIISV